MWFAFACDFVENRIRKNLLKTFCWLYVISLAYGNKKEYIIK